MNTKIEERMTKIRAKNEKEKHKIAYLFIIIKGQQKIIKINRKNQQRTHGSQQELYPTKSSRKIVISSEPFEKSSLASTETSESSMAKNRNK